MHIQATAVPILFASVALALGKPTGFGCPQTGPVIPPSAIDYDELSRSLASRLTNLTADATQSALGIDGKHTHFAVHVNGGGRILGSAYHTAKKLNSTGVKKVDGKTVFRMGSVSKVFAYLPTLLDDKMDTRDKIGKWIKELDPNSSEGKNAGTGKWWDEVTLEMLGSHTGGIQREEYEADFTFETPIGSSDALVSLGWPRISPAKPPFDCRFTDYDCMRKNVIVSAARSKPINAPGTRPMYSNLGFSLLSFALESATGAGFADATNSLIFDKLAMKDSTWVKPANSRGAIPVNGSEGWEMIPGVSLGPGAMYSTPDDMSTWLNSAHSLFKTQAAFERWLSPVVYLSSSFESVGAPWEIYRFNAFTPDNRPITLYSKSGDVPNYHSIIAFIPEYNITFSFFTSFAMTYSIEPLENYLVRAVIEEAEKAARKSAAKVFAGKYAGSNVTMTISVFETDNEAGLLVEELKKGKTDLLASFLGLTGLKPGPNKTLRGRLFSNDREGLQFRLMPNFNPKGQVKGLLTEGLYSEISSQCRMGWTIGGETYGGNEINMLKFQLNSKGVAKSIVIPSFQARLEKV